MFNVEAWERWRHERFIEYPCPRGKWRFDLELCHPRDNLTDVPIERNPHGMSFTGHSCFYSCDDWSTIFGVQDFSDHDFPRLRMLVESGHTEPIWGERIRLFSTSSYIQNEEWGSNVSNKFAYFRGKYWRVTMDHFLHRGHSELYEVMGGRITYPIRMEPYPFDGLPVAGPIENDADIFWLELVFEANRIFRGNFEDWKQRRNPAIKINWSEEGF